MVSAPAPKYCYGFQKGACARGADCPFLHEKDPKATEAKNGSHAKKTQARLSKEATPKKGTQKKGGWETNLCWERSEPGAKQQNRSGSRASAVAKTCFKCGSGKHIAPECKFDGECNYCKKPGHKESVCKKKKFDEKSCQHGRGTG